jgi:hypothetical protein
MNEQERPAGAGLEDAYLPASGGDVPSSDRHAAF